MIIFSLPFDEIASTVRWTDDDGTPERFLFASRVLALDFALDQATRREVLGSDVLLSIEGADGEWRNFDTHMKRYSRPLS